MDMDMDMELLSRDYTPNLAPDPRVMMLCDV